MGTGSHFTHKGQDLNIISISDYRETRAMLDDSVEPIKSIEGTGLSSGKWIRCDTPHCGNPAAGLIALRFFCVGHFISHCYEKLERCNWNPINDPDVVTSMAVDRFLKQCMAQAGELVRPIRGFDNLDRARLFDIFLWASDLIAKRSVFNPQSGPRSAPQSEPQTTSRTESSMHSVEQSRKAAAD